MLDLRPVGYIIGCILLVLGLLMLIPITVDYVQDNGNAAPLMQSAVFTAGAGGLLILTTRNGAGVGFDIRLAFLLTFAIWVLVPLFGALPFMIGAPQASFTDDYFEAVSGITATGSTIIVGLDGYPDGMNLWRGMLNWLGGLGIAFIAMIFLPVMRVGGMQFFRTEGFDTFGKALPRASDIAMSLLGVYAGLTALCIMAYSAVGMTTLDAVVNAFGTVATGGFSPADASFGKYPGLAEYVGALFMLLSGLPYIRYIQMVNGQTNAMWNDPQARAFVVWVLVAILTATTWRVISTGAEVEPAFRDATFNLVSIFTGTGFFSGSYASWGGFAQLIALIVGFIGGCSGSSTGALSVFRVQVAASAVMSQVKCVVSPNRVEPVRYAGRTVDTETINSVIMFVTGYILLTGVLSVAMTLTGVDTESALFGVWTSMGNIGYGFGAVVAPTGTFIEYPFSAKWILILAMLLGRLSLLAVLVIFLPQFWRR